MRIQVNGLDSLLTEFKTLENENIWAAMMKDAAHNMKRTAKQLCPVDTGMLRDSIYIRKMKNLSYEIGFTVYYGIYNEYGWYAIEQYIGTEESPIHYKGGYRPFLRPAVWREIRQMPDLLGQYFNILK